MSQPLVLHPFPEPDLAAAPAPRGLHVAIIMDGNGRWAAERGWPRSAGHAAGTEAVRRTVEAADGLGIGTLTLYAFSSDNWHRPQVEVRALMRLLQRYLEREARRCAENGIRVAAIGRRDRLPAPALRAIREVESITADNDRFLLRLAIDYSARDAIVRAASRLAASTSPSRDDFARLLAETASGAAPAPPAPDVDLLIRTGGEKRLSDFLLWECAYAELCFSDRMWPDFGAGDLKAALADFGCRERRFGRVL